MPYYGKNFDPNYKNRFQQAKPYSYTRPMQNTAFRNTQFPFQSNTATYYTDRFYQPYYPFAQPRYNYPFPQFYTTTNIKQSFFTYNEPYLAASDGNSLSAFATMDNYIHIFEALPLKNQNIYWYNARVRLCLVKIVYLTSDKAPMHTFYIYFAEGASVDVSGAFLIVCSTVGVFFLHIKRSIPSQGYNERFYQPGSYTVQLYSSNPTNSISYLTKFLVVRSAEYGTEFSFKYLSIEGDVYFDSLGHQVFGNNDLREYSISFSPVYKSVCDLRETARLTLLGRVCCIAAGGMVLQEVVEGRVVNRLLTFDANFNITQTYALDDVCYDAICCFEHYVCLTSFYGFGCLVSRTNGELKYFARMGYLIYKTQHLNIPRCAETLDSITWMVKEGENSILLSTSLGALLKIVFQFGEIMLVQDIINSFANDYVMWPFKQSQMTCFCLLKDCICCGYGGGTGVNAHAPIEDNDGAKQGRNGVVARVRYDNLEGENVCEVIHV